MSVYIRTESERESSKARRVKDESIAKVNEVLEKEHVKIGRRQDGYGLNPILYNVYIYYYFALY